MKKALILSLVLSAIASVSYAVETIRTKEDVRIKQGDSYIVELESNLTTGYAWELSSISKKNIVQIEELPYKLKIPCILGSGGKQSWKISAINKGTTPVVFDYKQSWEKDPVKTKTFYIVVE